ncbi:hypothetical protein ME763_32140 [Streptomyces murinus]|uniref:hypothetical protein n=1 Tax=Streptomyces murinus TaxID=33900 RepID=UPI000A1FE047|nr:hypothetical protein [Streptomyces murinus]WDO09941.1 hypothetical protein ME763_32140 [Streptomyces murinus]
MNENKKGTISGRNDLAAALERGDVAAVFISEGAEVPTAVVEAVVQQGVRVDIVEEDEDDARR